jgi:nucleoside-diphosphate-sugar epimerase
MKVFVTGSSSHLARALLPKLCAAHEVERVTGIDLEPPHFKHPAFAALRADIRDSRLADLMAGHNALIHLAFVVQRGRMSLHNMFEINVTGSMRVFHAARAAGIARLIQLSSAAVYGSGIHLAENAPFRPLPGFLYGEHKALLETMLAIEFPDCVRLRPHVILGPHAQPLLKSLLRQPFYLRLPRPHPLLQCVHEDDVADAILLCLKRDVSGPFNLAVEENLTYRELIKRRHKLALPLPLSAARAGLKLAWKFYGWGGEPAWINGLAHSLTLNCRRALVELAWQRRYDLAATLNAA